MQEKIFGIAFLVIGILIAFAFMDGISKPMINAGDNATGQNNCSDSIDGLGVPLNYNASDGYCYNSSATTSPQVHPAKVYSLPLSSMFSSSGIIFLVVMAGVLITLIIFVLRYAKK